MHLEQYDTIEGFLAVARPVLEQHEVLANLILGLSLRILESPGFYPEPIFRATVEDAGEILLVALMTPPHRLILYSPVEQFDEALKTLARHLDDNSIPVPGVNGPAAVSRKFAQLWQRLTSRSYSPTMRHRVYELTEVIPPAPVPGSMRPPKPEEADLLTRWFAAFQEESLHESDPEGARKMVEFMLAGDELRVWDADGRPVSMAATGRRTGRTVAVRSVYTPPEERRKGYASALVAQMSQYELDHGVKYCTLFTDLDYPTSNKIYMALGYRPIDDYLMFDFEKVE